MGEGCTGSGSNKFERVPWMKHLSGFELEQFLNISGIDKERWIANIPTRIFNETMTFVLNLKIIFVLGKVEKKKFN